MKHRARIAYSVAVASGLLATATHADQREIRLRGIYVAPANDSDAYAPLQIPEDPIYVNDKWIPEFDKTYFFTPHWPSELVLTYPQDQTVTLEQSALGGPATTGTFKHLPPPLTLKYNVMPGQVFQAYLGAGPNVTSIMDVDLQVPTVARLTLEHTSVGPAAQSGFDYQLAEHWYFNMDAKLLMPRSDVQFDAVKISQSRIDSVLLGVGFGYRF